ncbi:MAG: hypothetical protein JXB15_08065 [Anaerolineales bacterium]|nr:hypothetical protein [Anaerolineales bacterium]
MTGQLYQGLQDLNERLLKDWEVVARAAIMGFMRRLWMLPVLLLPLLACRLFSPVLPASSSSLSPSLAPDQTSTPAATPLPSLTPVTPTITASPIPTAEPVVPASTAAPAPSEFRVTLHPDGPLYVGDQISVEVIAPQSADLQESSAELQVQEAQGAEFLQVEFSSYGIAGRRQATFLWAWDTSGLAAGDYPLTISILPGETSWTETVTLLPGDQLPAAETQAAWAVAESDCCLVYYITGTKAASDMAALLEAVDEQAQKATRLLGIGLEAPVPIVFIPRVLGHGGFAWREVAVSYLERNYAGGDPKLVIHHEMVHLLDARLGGKLRPTMLVEGLAVYLTGGHFKLEPLMPRAAALLPPEVGCVPAADASQEPPPEGEACGLGRYLPLEPLLDNFYFAQHEIGYLQAGALVEYMIETWGWEQFSAFYRDIQPQPETADLGEEEKGPQARAMEAALQIHFGITLRQLELGFLSALQDEMVTAEYVQDVRLTVAFYDTVRRYQQMLDPSAYFMTAWILDGEQMRERGIVADYLRHPETPENVALETMLAAADADLRSGSFDAVEQLLAAIHAVLDVYAGDGDAPFSVHPMAQSYYQAALTYTQNRTPR